MNTQQLSWKQFLFRTLKGQLLLAGLAIAATYLITEHTTHVIQVLPFGFLMLCPLLHVFMHGGHGDHEDGHAGHSTRQDDDHQGHIH